MALRSSVTKSMQYCKELDKNVLPLNKDVVGHYFYVGKPLTETNPKFFNKMPYFKDVKD